VRRAGLQHGVRGVTETRPDQIESTYAWITSTPHPVVITDAQGGVLAQNAAFEHLFSASDPGLPSDSVEDLIITSRYRAAYRAPTGAGRWTSGGCRSGEPVRRGSPGRGRVSDQPEACRDQRGPYPRRYLDPRPDGRPQGHDTNPDAGDSVRAGGGAGWIRELGMDV
jgi:hypothetical protein